MNLFYIGKLLLAQNPAQLWRNESNRTCNFLIFQERTYLILKKKRHLECRGFLLKTSLQNLDWTEASQKNREAFYLKNRVLQYNKTLQTKIPNSKQLQYQLQLWEIITRSILEDMDQIANLHAEMDFLFKGGRSK